MDKHPPALSPDEFNDGTVERSPAHKWDLEAASLDRDGTLNVWNASGQTVEISLRNRDAVIALLLQGRLRVGHLNALIEATGEEPVAIQTKDALKDLFDQISRYAPPPMSPALRADVGAAALLWTVSPELRITSCTGNAKRFMRESDRELLAQAPDLWTLLGTTDPAHPLIAGHLQALAGESRKFVHQRGAEWAIYLQPVRDEDGEIAGVVGYATVTAKLPDVPAPAPVEASFVLTSPDGIVLNLTGDLLRMLSGRSGSSNDVIGQEVIQIAHDHFIGVVERPKEFVKRLAAVLTSEVEETDRIVLTDGRVLHRHMQPLKDSVGNVLARAWVVTEAVARRATTTVAASLLVAALGIGTILPLGDNDADLHAVVELAMAM